MNRNKMNRNGELLINALAGLALALLISACAKPSPVVFDSPEAAVQALADVIGQNDPARVAEIFGPGSLDLLQSGDESADRADFARVGEMIAAGVEFHDFDENTKIALFGDEAWPLPIPLVRDGDGWRFDIALGQEELLNRRIGNNELWTLTALHEVVDAQREYRAAGRDGNPPAYAQRFLSSEGRRDGLYWPPGEGEDLSPLGDLLAGSDAHASNPSPFHGYYYRMLTRRGPHAPGGERDCLDPQGALTGCFGVIAWPAKYGNSGVMTFITDQRGIVFQKDLGADTGQAVAAIESYDPGPEWSPTPDRVTEP
jgi:hypothetical protein